MTPSSFDCLVPRETQDCLRKFLDLLTHWNRRINLLSRSESSDLWRRHIVDSAQLVPLAPISARSWLDIGAGAGFPGIVCAIITAAQGRSTIFTLVEADSRKAAFLREAVRVLELDARVINERIEQAVLPPQDIISARALAPLSKLLDYAHPFTHAHTRLLFLKGRKGESELTAARCAWHIRLTRMPSRTDPDGAVFQISEVRQRS